MDIDVVIKVATFFLGIIGTGKLLYDLSIGKRSRMRDEYKFAKEFLEDRAKNDEMHPFLRETGYRAIAGDDRLSADEVEYLLSLKGSERALKDYVMGRSYLEHFTKIGNLQISFKRKYQSLWSRRWRRLSYLCLYVIFSTLAWGPFVFSKFLFHNPREMLVASGLSIVVFGPYAWFALKAGIRIHRAEKLVEHQDKHTQIILIDRVTPHRERLRDAATPARKA